MTAGPHRGQSGFPGGDPSGDSQALLRRLLGPSLGNARAERCAQALVDRFGDVGAGIIAPREEVSRLLGDDAAPCVALLEDLHALVLAVLRRKAISRPILGGRAALKRYLSTALSGEPREQFRVLYLDSRNGLIREEIAGVGTRDHAPVYPREIVRRALELSASGLILVHNHPSGDPTPSDQDIRTTVQIVAAAAVFEISVHDHLVVGQRRVFSFHDAGLIGDTLSDRWTALAPVRRQTARSAGSAGSASAARSPATASVHSA